MHPAAQRSKTDIPVKRDKGKGGGTRAASAAAKISNEKTGRGPIRSAYAAAQGKDSAMQTIGQALSAASRRLAALCLTLILFGCATSGQMTDVEAPKPGQALVFGSVTVLEDGKPQKWGMTWTGTREFWLLLLPKDGTRAISYRLGNDGTFAWGLEPGNYSIAGYELSKGGQSRSGRIWAQFTVPEESKSLYIGHLEIEFIGGLYRYGVDDRYDAALESFHTEFPDVIGAPGKAVMEIEHDVGSFTHKGYICDAAWGIACSKTYTGITPIRPEVTKGGSTAVDSVVPTFEWRPSSAAGVTYDLVLYRAIAYSRDIMQIKPQYMAGPVVAYEEGLKAATWRPATPLQPNRRYYWSVRLRRGDRVTNWSTYSFFHFYLVASESGVGRLFSFSTPAE